MDPSRIVRENQAIAQFTRSRILPALDEFQVAHKLAVSVDSGVFALLAGRLVKEAGLPIETVVDLAKKSAERALNGSAPQPPASADVPSARHDVGGDIDPVIIPFRGKQTK